MLALLCALALAQGGEKVQEVKEILEHEIGEKVRETREKDMKDNNPYDRVVAVKFELGGTRNEVGQFHEKVFSFSFFCCCLFVPQSFFFLPLFPFFKNNIIFFFFFFFFCSSSI